MSSTKLIQLVLLKGFRGYGIGGKNQRLYDQANDNYHSQFELGKDTRPGYNSFGLIGHTFSLSNLNA